VNWRCPQGYGALVAAAGAQAPVTLDCPVRRIDRSGTRLRLETDKGTLSAALAIVTVPTPLIARGDLSFVPDLPALREAAEGTPLGLANKVHLAVEDASVFEPESHLFGDPWRTATGSYHLRPFGRPLIEVYLGGAHARDLETQDAAAFAIEELARLLGSDIRRRLRPLAVTAWGAEPWSLGSYSHALPGRAADRGRLTQTHDERILIAGEAASPHNFSTAHGAHETGREAAERALELLG
jgi:monoamine oxidase